MNIDRATAIRQILFAQGHLSISRIAEAVSYLHYLVLRSFTHPGPVFGSVPGSVVLSIGVLLVIEWWRRDFRHPLEDMALPTYVRWAIYLVLLTAIALQGDPTVSNQFIYFQF